MTIPELAGIVMPLQKLPAFPPLYHCGLDEFRVKCGNYQTWLVTQIQREHSQSA
jgi:hypothetical protein